MRTEILLNKDWCFKAGFELSDTTAENFADYQNVLLPHTVEELPFNYFDEKCYQRQYTYQLQLTPELLQSVTGKRQAYLLFEGVMAYCQVYLNGQLLQEHKGGYTPFEVHLGKALKNGQNNLLTVMVDASERADIPPFGGQIDYLTYGGIYRDVRLLVTDEVSIANLKIETQDTLAEKKSVTVDCFFRNPGNYNGAIEVKVNLKNLSGEVLASNLGKCYMLDGSPVRVSLNELENMQLWEPGNPALYQIECELSSDAGNDCWQQNFGFRTAEFTPEGFLLNNKPLKIRGINRHQSWPYVGYAMGQRAQEKDAEIIKYDLGFDLVRTSHYPQSKYFLDHCDRIGLLVFEEIPGWQHLGEGEWKDLVCQDVSDMIRRDWNHPSIIMWGVRVNESQDDDTLYTRTNAIAHELDTTRQTGGVRFITESNLLEDVYTMNDFIHEGKDEILRDQQEVTGLDHKVPYIVTEFNGHMFPTKRFDQEERQHEHTMRHLRIMNRMYGDSGISGCIGWCFFDYNTHKDFGSGDRICYHGITDMFRIEKFAAYAYASQMDPTVKPVLQAATFWSRGERSIGGVMPLLVLTNCDYIEFQYGDCDVRRIYPDRETFEHLPHAPVIIDERSVTPSELGSWGLEWSEVVMAGYVDGEKVIERRYACDPVPHTLSVQADHQQLSAGVKDATRIVIKGLDQAGNPMAFWNPVVELSLKGPGRILGPSKVALSGGAIATYVETKLEAGMLELTVSCEGMETQTINIEVL
ncbi:glycoside hydrolase family 2 protein [Gynuella sp.]|uniref:glycoside hydrolase family 2 protein n=1 Tax=Gynuella sp. TaxID=2969146 RepID=UPI003D111CBD